MLFNPVSQLQGECCGFVWVHVTVCSCLFVCY